MLEESGKNEPIYFEVHRRLNIEKNKNKKFLCDVKETKL